MQSRGMSLVEAVTNIAVGYVIAAVLTWLVLPLFGAPVGVADALGISLVFTVVSLIRSYLLRRLFVRLQ